VAFLTRFHHELGDFPHPQSLRMALRAFRVILETVKAFFSIIRPPLVENLTRYTKFSRDLTDIAYVLIPLKPILSWLFSL